MKFHRPYFLSELFPSFSFSDNLNCTIPIRGICDHREPKSGYLIFCFDQKAFLEIEKNILNYQDIAYLIVSSKTPLSSEISSCLRILAVDQPRLVFQKTLESLAADHHFASVLDSGIDPTAKIHPQARIGSDVRIGPFTVIEADVEIENHAVIGSHCYIGNRSHLKDYAQLGSHCVLEAGVTIGSRTVIQHHTTIGSQGFGFEREGAFWKQIPHLSGVSIGDDCFIGSHVAIAAGVLNPTTIANKVIIDNHVQIAHHVDIGEGTAIAGCVGIAGSAQIGQYCLIGGAAKIAGHIKIADKVQITGMTMVTKSLLEPGIYSSGMPVDTNKEWKKKVIALNKITRTYFEKSEQE